MFLFESRWFLFKEAGEWHEAAPWVYVWLVVTVYIFGQAAAREIFHLELTVNGVEFARVYWPARIPVRGADSANPARNWPLRRRFN